MVFSSATFIFVFLPIALIAYLATPKKWKNAILLITGLLFYAWGEFSHIYFILITILVDFACGFMISKNDDNPKKRKLFLLISIFVNFGLLGVFKYSSFIISTINGIFGTSIPDPNLPLPVGISFYTFSSVTYVLDIYMRNVSVQKSLVDYGAYVTMFPKLIIGPIVQYKQIESELSDRTITTEKISDGVMLFIQGLAKKTLLSETIGGLWITIKTFPINELSVGTAWLGILAYTFNIYLDFSGYSDMARGLGKMLGFDFPINFDYPYISSSISEFWRRWHMTLGRWFRDYIYIPLGGNRCSKAKYIRNLLVVWMFTGLWHGANWNFVIWGLYFGVLIIIEKVILGNKIKKIPCAIGKAYTFILVVLGWVLFDFTKISDITGFYKALFGGNGSGIIDEKFLYYLSSYIVIFLLCIIASTGGIKKVSKLIINKWKIVGDIGKPIVYIGIFIICISYLVEATNSPFLYFKF